MNHKLVGLIISIHKLRWWLIGVRGNAFAAIFSQQEPVIPGGSRNENKAFLFGKLLHSLILFVHGWEVCSQLNRSRSSHTGLFKAINEGNLRLK